MGRRRRLIFVCSVFYLQIFNIYKGIIYVKKNGHSFFIYFNFSDGRYYEIVKANFERADRLTVVRTYTSCRVSLYYLLSNYKDLIFN